MEQHQPRDGDTDDWQVGNTVHLTVASWVTVIANGKESLLCLTVDLGFPVTIISTKVCNRIQGLTRRPSQLGLTFFTVQSMRLGREGEVCAEAGYIYYLAWEI